MRVAGILSTVVLAAILLLLHGGSQAQAKDTDCWTSLEAVCINIGESVSIKVTSDLLGMKCVDSKGNPDHELIGVDETGAPDTGGAGVTWDRDVFAAYSEYATLTVHTTLTTKPGLYAIAIEGTGVHCGKYPGFTWYIGVRPLLDGRSVIWSFGGPKIPGYRTEATLEALPAGMGPYQWYVPITSVLRFPNNQSTITTATNTVKVHALRGQIKDQTPGVFVIVKGGFSLTKDIKVRAPSGLEYLEDPVHLSDPVRGYRSVWEYIVVDQWGFPLPKGLNVPVRLRWVNSSWARIFKTANWTRPPDGITFTADPDHVRLSVFPVTLGHVPVKDGRPTAQHPSGGTTRIDCWKVDVYVGADATHDGIKVARQNWLRYRDHGTAEAPSCP